MLHFVCKFFQPFFFRKSSLKGILRKKIQEYLKENPDLKVSDVIAPQILKDGEILNSQACLMISKKSQNLKSLRKILSILSK